METTEGERIGKDQLIEETKEYYRQRAKQYFDWAHKTHDHGGEQEPDQSFFDEAKTLLDALDKEHLTGRVLEIACGTGVWTEAVVKSADQLTALDSSNEMIERNRSRLKDDPRVTYVVADVYDWVPDREYDAVTFSFWISHVPSSRLDEFVSKVSRSLKKGGRVFFVDQQPTAKEHEPLESSDGEVSTRTLLDGKTFRVVKHFYLPDEVHKAFLRHGIGTRLTNTPTHFYHVAGTKR